MSTLDDDLAAAQAEDSPSLAAAVKAAIDKQPAETQEPQPLPADDEPGDDDQDALD